MSAKKAEELFLANKKLVDRMVRTVCRIHRCRADETEDFCSEVYVKLIADDYAVLRKFKGESQLATYLTTVINHHFSDYCDRRWGRFRPSAVARRLGVVAVQLERLLVRDGHTLSEACQVLRTDYGVELSEDEITALARRLPVRTRRRFVGEDQLDGLADPDARADHAALQREHAELRRRVNEAIERAFASLPAEDRLPARMRFMEGCRVVDIAAALGLEASPLYPQLEAARKFLRRRFEEVGIGPEILDELLSDEEGE